MSAVPRILLERFLESNEGTFGTMTLGEQASAVVLFTCEPQWRNNEHGVSCIPEGSYVLKPHFSPKLGINTYEITGVPSRGSIIIHPGNTEENTEGCVLVGKALGVVAVRDDEELHVQTRKLAVVQSKLAFDMFMGFMAAAPEGTITVRWDAGRKPAQAAPLP